MKNAIAEAGCVGLSNAILLANISIASSLTATPTTSPTRQPGSAGPIRTAETETP